MKKIQFLFMAVVAVLLSSCFATRTTIGDFNKLTDNGDTNVALVSKTKQCYAVSNLVPLGLKHAETPPSGNCQITTKYNALDMLVSMCTGNLFSMKTIKVYGLVSEGYKPQEPKPVINNGLQYELEGGWTVGGSVAVSYKFAKRYSIGFGYWLGYFWSKDLSIVNHIENTTGMYKIFCSAQIRPWNKGFSPVVGGYLGWQTINLSDYQEGYNRPSLYGYSQTQMFLLPYVGLSFRCGSNCYITWKVGYNMAAGNIKMTDEYKEYNSQYSFWGYPEKINASYPYTALNFTHTLPIGAGLHTKAAEKVRKVMNRD